MGNFPTVQNYHYLVKAKTGMRTDAQLVRLAAECGLADLGPRLPWHWVPAIA
ncbi:MAG: hypothetical protein ACLQDM_22390 [Bradyrhizobium sp.]